MKHSLIRYVLLICIYCFPTFMFAQGVYRNESILMEKTEKHIHEVAKELKEKTGISFYVVALQKIPDGKTFREFEKSSTQTFNGEYVFLLLSVAEKKVDLTFSESLAGIIPKDDILNDYVVPILIRSNDKVTIEQKYAAALYNGSVRTMTLIASARNQTLTSAPNESNEVQVTTMSRLIWVLITITFLIAVFLLYRKFGTSRLT